jgi:hypothetical protein
MARNMIMQPNRDCLPCDITENHKHCTKTFTAHPLEDVSTMSDLMVAAIDYVSSILAFLRRTKVPSCFECHCVGSLVAVPSLECLKQTAITAAGIIAEDGQCLKETQSP